MNEVTVCIKTFLRDQQLYRCIETLRSCYSDIRISVIDDGILDQTKSDKMKQLDVSYFFYPFNSLGLTKGRNIMLSKVETPYFVICDDDSVWTKDSRLEDLKKLMDIADLASGTVRTLGVIGHYEGNWTRSADDGLIYNRRGLNDLSSYKGIHYTSVDLADEFYMSKTELFRGGMWDENLRVLYQHSDSFLTMKERHLDVVYAPDCIIDHKSADLLQTDEYSGFRYGVENEKAKNYFLKKWQYKYLVLFDGSREDLK